MNKKTVWKALFVLGLCPFWAPFAYCFILIFIHNAHSFTLPDLIILWSVIYWPTYIVGGLLSAFSVYRLKN